MLSKASFAALVPVKKMDRAIGFYTDTLGGKLRMRGEGEMKDMWASVTVNKAEFWLIKPEKQEKMELAYNVFVVGGIKKTVKGLVEKGVKFEPAEDMGPGSKKDGPIATTPWGAKSAFFKDSEGNLLMLWEEAPST
jgi:catechol 2,3-dioxygenase-like lactoylglutathione lyase family enzyme